MMMGEAEEGNASGMPDEWVVEEPVISIEAAAEVVEAMAVADIGRG